MDKITTKGQLSQPINDEKVHLIIEQTMEITYVDNILTHQLLDDRQEVCQKQSYKE